MTGHVFVDETKDRRYLVAAACVQPAELASARQVMAGFLKQGQRRIHFAKEADPRRREIISGICRLPLTVTMYDASGIRDQRAARRACLESLVDDAATSRARMLVIEQDDSLKASDQRILY